jgi:pimeloyl-ACP methyl ester carboxylesterase
MWLPILFTPSHTSQRAGRAYIERILTRTDRDAPVSEQAITAQLAAIHAYGAAKDPSYSHLKKLTQPTLVVNGGHDVVITTVNSYLLQQFLPDAQLILYPDANHGAHHQHHDLFVTHARLFLDAVGTHDDPARVSHDRWPSGAWASRATQRPDQ